VYVVCEAASSVDTGLVLSTYSTCSLEQLSVAAASDAVLLLQLYVSRHDDVTRRLISRAQRARCCAVVVTVDTPVIGKRRADLYHAFRLPAHLQSVIFTQSLPTDAIWLRGYWLLACVCLCLSVSTLSHADIVLQRLQGSSSFWRTCFAMHCILKKSPYLQKYGVLPCGTLSQTLAVENLPMACRPGR